MLDCLGPKEYSLGPLLDVGHDSSSDRNVTIGVVTHKISVTVR
jgi:hypothetical protein